MSQDESQCCLCLLTPEEYVQLQCSHDYCLSCLSYIYLEQQNTKMDESSFSKIQCKKCQVFTKLDQSSIEAIDQTLALLIKQQEYIQETEQKQVKSHLKSNRLKKNRSSDKELQIHTQTTQDHLQQQVILEDSEEYLPNTQENFYNQNMAQQQNNVQNQVQNQVYNQVQNQVYNQVYNQVQNKNQIQYQNKNQEQNQKNRSQRASELPRQNSFLPQDLPKNAQFYCMSCEELVFSIEQHRFHKCIPYQQATQLLVQQLQDQLKDQQATQNAYLQLIEVKKQNKQTSLHIKNSFDALKNQILEFTHTQFELIEQQNRQLTETQNQMVQTDIDLLLHKLDYYKHIQQDIDKQNFDGLFTLFKEQKGWVNAPVQQHQPMASDFLLGHYKKFERIKQQITEFRPMDVPKDVQTERLLQINQPNSNEIEGQENGQIQDKQTKKLVFSSLQRERSLDEKLNSFFTQKNQKNSFQFQQNQSKDQKDTFKDKFQNRKKYNTLKHNEFDNLHKQEQLTFDHVRQAPTRLQNRSKDKSPNTNQRIPTFGSFQANIDLNHQLKQNYMQNKTQNLKEYKYSSREQKFRM